MIDVNERAKQLVAQCAQKPEKNIPTQPSAEAVGHAMAEIVSDPEKAIKTKLSKIVIDKIDNDDDIAKKVDNLADELIDGSTEKVKNESEKGVKKALYENNISACSLIGVNEDTTPGWVIKIAQAIEAFWYAIWCIIASVTVAPIVFLCIKIRIILKKTWVAAVVAVIVYLGVTFIPVLLKMCNIY